MATGFQVFVMSRAALERKGCALACCALASACPVSAPTLWHAGRGRAQRCGHRLEAALGAAVYTC